MKAVRCRPYGDSGVLVYEEADHPVARPGHTPPAASRVLPGYRQPAVAVSKELI